MARYTKGLQQVIKALDRLTSEATRRDMLKVAGQTLVDCTVDRFRTETDPMGKPWKKSKRAKRQRGQTLSDTARLRRSFSYRVVNSHTVAYGTNVDYAIYHQKPTYHPQQTRTINFRVNRRTGRSRFAKQKRANFSQTVTIPAYTTPARKMLPETVLPPSYQRALTRSLEAALRRNVGGGTP